MLLFWINICLFVRWKCCFVIDYTKHQFDSMLGHCLWCWPSIETSLGETSLGKCILFLKCSPLLLQLHYKGKHIYTGREPNNIGIQINWKEITKTFMTISNWKKTFGLQGFQKTNQRFKG